MICPATTPLPRTIPVASQPRNPEHPTPAQRPPHPLYPADCALNSSPGILLPAGMWDPPPAGARMNGTLHALARSVWRGQRGSSALLHDLSAARASSLMAPDDLQLVPGSLGGFHSPRQASGHLGALGDARVAANKSTTSPSANSITTSDVHQISPCQHIHLPHHWLRRQRQGKHLR